MVASCCTRPGTVNNHRDLAGLQHLRRGHADIGQGNRVGRGTVHMADVVNPLENFGGFGRCKRARPVIIGIRRDAVGEHGGVNHQPGRFQAIDAIGFNGIAVFNGQLLRQLAEFLRGPRFFRIGVGIRNTQLVKDILVCSR